MSTVLSVYSRNAFKEFLLPAINDADHSIVLSRSIFGLNRDLEIKLEVIDNKWSFVYSDEYDLVHNKTVYFGQEISDGDIIRLTHGRAVDIVIIVKETGSYFSVFKKYDIGDIDFPITIGEGAGNVITYSFLNIISQNHARIIKRERSFFLEDIGNKNGVFINNVRVQGSKALQYGDCIDIYGLRMVYLGEVLAVNTIASSAKVDGSRLRDYEIRISGGSEKNHRAVAEVFHRAPRRIPKIDTEPIEIDAAPNPRELNQPSLLLTISAREKAWRGRIRDHLPRLGYEPSDQDSGKGVWLFTNSWLIFLNTRGITDLGL